ncbi:Mrx12p KNAG_0M01810 [Huiozyma naganishii CBS 8797]|uniref:Uncharacterized protein n=1 Tax=Huiozyma naganishii (strain ATCC MYA-139 / BCRC 22969 / CBS 8797 / KCTC 17520 / NBRC 10181 / NCYC 3082 / Yp74L-3) TaxID=1071383 RepID=J7SAT9_HUIN7|nr:hypothetical protein KNAG_0M01810 [Kazachstania naganishii CBS 8797]CCK73034.1 hypothetical protein KNAG_0M01810 [Kazachstania naganishii CBS 8797]
MLTFKRSFSKCLKLSEQLKPSLHKAYQELFQQKCFDPIRDQLPEDLKDLDPYEVSSKIGESLSQRPKTSFKQQGFIHNAMIEQLAGHDYSIATIHSKKLQEINEPLTSKALLEVIKNNPGRVNSSWELFVTYSKIFGTLSQDILLEVLNKVVYFDSAEINDGKKALDIYDITHAIYLLDHISDRNLIKRGLIDKLTKDTIDLDASYILPALLNFDPSFDLFLEKLDKLTPYQLYLIYPYVPKDLLKTNKELLYAMLSNIGENKIIDFTDEETAAFHSIVEQFESVKLKLSDNSWNPESTLNMKPVSTESEFDDLLDFISKEDLHKSDIGLAKKVLRSIGMFRNDTKLFMELYRILLSSHCGKEEDIFFEVFLAMAYQSFKTADKASWEFAEAFVPETASDATRAKILTVQILALSKFDIDESLKIYNANIQQLSKEKNNKTETSPSDNLTEALILGYLANKDLDFARVILEGATGSKTLSGLTAVKSIKQALSDYGEAAENGEIDTLMNEKILRYLAGM